MKQILLILFTVLGFHASAQIPPPRELNQPRNEHYQISCNDTLINFGYNLIPNPSFIFKNDSLEAFSNGDVYMWQDINNLTSDINGALGDSMGCTLPVVPNNLGLTNFASMLVDQYNEHIEGIAAKTLPLIDGEKYALSFFLSTSQLSTYREYGGIFTLKIYLANCQNFGVQTSGSPEIVGEKQLIFCKSFERIEDSEWQQYFITFTAEYDFDMIIIYPEVEEGHTFDGGTYVHFLYPELIHVNPIATFVPGDSTGGKIRLIANGVVNAQVAWEGLGHITDSLNYITPITLLSDEYNFNMWVEGALGNDLDNCIDDDPAIINQIATLLTVESSVECKTCVSSGTCNMIPNPVFSYTIPSPEPWPGYQGEHAFYYGFVDGWSHISYGSTDIGGSWPNYPVPPLPTAISDYYTPLGITVNSAGIQLSNTYSVWYEGMSVKTEPIREGKKYMLSLYVSRVGNPDCSLYNLKVIATNCQELDRHDPPTSPPFPPMPPLVINGNFQEVFCQLGPAASGPQWTQYAITFEAQNDFDMLVFYPELLTPPHPDNCTVYLMILHPELVEIDNLVTIENNSTDQIVLKSCGVTNAIFDWRDENNLSVGSASELEIDPTRNPGDYSVTVCVPDVLNNPLLNNSCSVSIGCVSSITIANSIWTGITSKDWNTASNWNTNAVPNSNSVDVYIPAGTSYAPEIIFQTPTPNEVQVNNITLAHGALLTNNGWLKVAGKLDGGEATIDNYYTDPITNERTILGSIEINGTCAPQAIAGNTFIDNDVKDFKVSNNVTVSDFNTAPGEGVEVHGELSFGATNTVLTTGDNLTLVSTASTTANVAQIDASNFIDGEVTVERHILTGTGIGEHDPKWQALATPTGANSIGQSVYESWMENGLSTTIANGYGTNIPDPRSNWAALGFDQQSANGFTAIKTYNSATNGFNSIANTGIPLYNRNGYFLFVRGDRSKTLFLGSPNPTNLRSKGALFQPRSGYAPPDVTVAANGKFELIGNPYASAIDIDYMRTNGHFSNLTNHVTVWDPLIPGTQGLGGYQVLSAPNYTPTPGGTSGNTHYVSGVSYNEIQSGQAFFMQTSGANPGTVSFSESVKSTNSRLVSKSGNSPKIKSFRASLFSGTGICDGNAILYGNKFSNDIDADDAGRPFNPGENFLVCKNNDIFLTVESRANIKKVDSIFYAFKNLRKIQYRLIFAVENLAGEGLYATLIDNYLNKKTSLSLTDSSFIEFTVDDKKESYENRFIVVFEKNIQKEPAITGFLNQGTDFNSPGYFSVYPNPVKDKTINIYYTDLPCGKYSAQLIKQTGQILYNMQFMINDKEGVITVRPDQRIPAGAYQIVIINGSGKKYSRQIIF